MREAYRAVERGVFNLDVILAHSVRYRLEELSAVFAQETVAAEQQSSLKTLIIP